MLATLALALVAAKPPEGVVYTSLTAGRLNPLGLSQAFELGAQFRLSDSDSILLEDTFAGLYFTPLLAPAFLNPGLTLRVQPLAVLRLEARYSWIQYLGTSKLIQSFRSPRERIDDTTLSARSDAELNYATGGVNLTLAGELRAKVGPVAARSRFQATFHDMDLREGDTVWYDQITDLVPPKMGWMLTNDLDVLYQLPFDGGAMFMAGARYAFGVPIYDARAYAPGEPNEHDNGPNHRLGPMFVYTFFEEPGAAFNKPSIIAIFNWHLAHRSRTGEDSSAALPYIALAFAFTGELGYIGRTK